MANNQIQSIEDYEVSTIEGLSQFAQIAKSLLMEGSLDGASGNFSLGQVLNLFLQEIPDSRIIINHNDESIPASALAFLGSSISVAASDSSVDITVNDVEIVSDGINLKWKYANEVEFKNIVAIADLRGPAGKSVEMQVTETHLQWRQEGGTWENLLALSSIKGSDGKQVELQKGTTHLQWRYVGESNWTDLVALSELKGDNGRNPELQKSTTHIQWRLVGDTQWNNLVALADLKGEAGTGLVNRNNWVTGTIYNPGDYVFASSSEDADSNSMFIAQGSVPFESTIEPKDDPQNWVEFSAPAGANGKQVEMQATGTAIQWRYEGETWIDLIQLSAIKGADGREVELGTSATHIQWRYVGGAWNNLVPLSTLTGPSGREVELRASSTHIQWRYVGDATWTNLVSLDSLKGNDGKEVELQKGTTAIQWRYVGDTSWQDLVLISDLRGANGVGIASYNIAYQQSSSGTVTPTGEWLNSVPTVDSGFYLWCRTTITYTDESTSIAYSVSYNGKDGTNNVGTTTWLMTAEPAAAVGAQGDVALVKLPSGTIQTWQKGASAWIKSWEQKIANTAEAQSAALSTIPISPAGVREYLEQFGLTSTYTTAPEDLNSIVKGSFFNWGNTTLHSPLAGSYGRGICLPSGSGYVTQWGIENTSGKMFARFQENGTWTDWGEVGGGGGEGGSYTLPIASATVLGGVKIGSGLSINASGVLSATGSGDGGTSDIINVLQAPFVNQQTTLKPISTVSVTAGQVYKVSFLAVIKPTAKTIGFKIGTAGSFGALTINLHSLYNDGDGIVEQTLITKQSVAEFPASEYYANEGNLLRIEGLLHVITSGDFGFSFAVMNEWDYASVIAGSSLILTPLGTAPTT